MSGHEEQQLMEFKSDFNKDFILVDGNFYALVLDENREELFLNIDEYLQYRFKNQTK